MRELVGIARSSGSDLTAEASLRSSIQCDYRPATTYVDGRCVSDPGSVPAKGGTLMVGDSLTWRGTDELARLQGRLTIDGEPARQISELQGRLDYYVSGAGQPDRTDRRARRRPAARRLREVGPGPDDQERAALHEGHVRHAVRRAAERQHLTADHHDRLLDAAIAKARGRACVADWPSFVRSRPGLIQDGVHVKNTQERTWAKFISQQWGRC